MSDIKVYSIDQLKDIFTEIKDKVNSLSVAEINNIKPFNECTFTDLSMYLNAYYKGILSLSDIQEAWMIGDSISVNVNAIPEFGDGRTFPTGIVSAMQAHDYTFKIVDMDHDTLATPINGITKALLTLAPMQTTYSGVKTAASEPSSAANFYRWIDQPIRYWCNNYYYNSLPDNLKYCIKTVLKPYATEVSVDSAVSYAEDKIFLPSLKEMGASDNHSANGRNTEGTPYPYFSYSGGRRSLPSANGSGSVRYRLRTTNTTGIIVIIPNEGGKAWATGTTVSENSCLPMFCV